MAYIYKIINDINDKVYIGQTSFTIRKRWQEHVADSKKNLPNRPLYKAFAKYGIEHFSIEIIEETEYPNEREEYWIHYYDSCHNGYNATFGGEGRPYNFTADELTQLAQLYNNKVSISDIAKILHHDASTIKNQLIKMGYTIDTHRNLNMAVYQIDKQTNQVLNTYMSCHAAARALGDDTKNAHIRECCRGLRKTAYGYKWQFVSDYTGVE